MLTILVDMDGTITDTLGSIVSDLNRRFNSLRYPRLSKKISLNDCVEYNFTNFSENDRRVILNMFGVPGTYSRAAAYPYAVQVIKSWLNQPERYKVKFVTHFFPEWHTAYYEKVQWLQENFHIDLARDFIVCKDRSNLVFDILIDDCWQNIIWCLEERPCGDYILPAHPWNLCADVDNLSVFRPADWPAIAQLVEEITNAGPPY